MSTATLWPTRREPNARLFVTAAISMSPGADAALPTVTIIESLAEPACATITADPALSPVTRPVALTEATDGLRLVQVASEGGSSTPPASLTVSDSCSVWFGAVVRMAPYPGVTMTVAGTAAATTNDTLTVCGLLPATGELTCTVAVYVPAARAPVVAARVTVAGAVVVLRLAPSQPVAPGP